MKAFDSLRLAAFIIGGLFGLVFLMRGCTDKHALSTSAHEDFLVLTSTFSKKVSGGRFQSSRRETYVYGHVASSGVRHELSIYDACRHIDCTGIKENLTFPYAKKGDTITYRTPIWSANNGRTIAPRKPGDKTVNMKQADGEIYGGLLLASLIVVPLLLWLAFGNGKVV